MKHSLSFLILCCVLALPVGLYVMRGYAGTEKPDTVSIVTDQNRGTITFIVDGEAMAQINGNGLHVVENINYGGVLTDTGSAHIEKIIQAEGQDVE